MPSEQRKRWAEDPDANRTPPLHALRMDSGLARAFCPSCKGGTLQDRSASTVPRRCRNDKESVVVVSFRIGTLGGTKSCTTPNHHRQYCQADLYASLVTPAQRSAGRLERQTTVLLKSEPDLHVLREYGTLRWRVRRRPVASTDPNGGET